jgi:hypothetical protein
MLAHWILRMDCQYIFEFSSLECILRCTQNWPKWLCPCVREGIFQYAPIFQVENNSTHWSLKICCCRLICWKF